MAANYFSEIEPVRYAGPETNDPLAYRYYDAKRVVLGKTMEEHLRISVAYWHTFCSAGADMFGGGTWDRPWHKGSDPVAMAEHKLEEAMSFIKKLGVPFYAFHDRDLAPDLGNMRDSQKAFAHMVDKAALAQEQSGIKLLWGTANLFSNPRYMAGGATNPDPEVYACAALQVRDALEATKKLNGSAYVLWGGREGYETLLNTDLKREMAQMGRFLQMVVEHKYKIGFDGLILIEPKPMEPSKHQYDFDVATVYGFLKQYGLYGDLNIGCIESTQASLEAENGSVTVFAGTQGTLDVKNSYGDTNIYEMQKADAYGYDLRTEYGEIHFSGYEMMENENGDAAEYRKQAPGSAVIRVSAENGDIKIRENVAQSTLEETVAETKSVDEEE